MAKIQTPFNPEVPIPNNPFYSPETNALQGVAGPLIVGAGFTINYATGVISSSGGGGTLVSVTAGTALTANGVPGGVITTTGTLALEDTAVTAGSYTRADITVDAQGRITAATDGTGGGTVTSVGTGTGLTGGPITASGTVSLADTAVTPGSYTLGSFTVDAQGRLTVASSGTAVTVVTATAPVVSTGGVSPVISLQTSGVTPNIYTNASVTVNGFGIITAANSGLAPVTSISVIGPLTKFGTTTPVLSIGGASTGQPGVVQVGTNIQIDGLGVISVDSASTSLSGIVQLNNTVTSTSVTEALTANQGKLLQDQITSLVVAGNIDLAGTIDASTGLVASVTSIGTTNGYTVGSVLPAASATTNNSYVITTEPGTLTPPGGSPTVATRGDWFLVSELTPGNYSWTFLNVGTDVSAASTGTAGVVQLATVAQTQSGTDNSLAVTPLSAAGTYIPLTALTAKGAILGASAANTPSALPVGADGEYLVADSSQATGLAWGALSQDFIPETTFTAAGEVITGTGVGTYVALAVGANGEYLVADSTCVGGLKWFTPDYLQPSLFTAKGSLLTATGAGAPIALPVGADSQILVANSTCTGGLQWATNPAILCCILNTRGDLVIALGNDFPSVLPAGTTGQFLTVNAGCVPGLEWINLPQATPTAFGAVKGSTTPTSTALGCNALLGSPGDNNVAIGFNAGRLISSGSGNVAVGANSFCSSTIAQGNVAIGIDSLARNINGVNNVAIGNSAGINTTGSGNVLLGSQAGQSLVSVARNVFVGEQAGCSGVTSSNQTGVGWEALSASTGQCNVALGASAGANITTASCSVMIGPGVCTPQPTIDRQLAIGVGSNYWMEGNQEFSVFFNGNALFTNGGQVIEDLAIGQSGFINSTFCANSGKVLILGNNAGAGKVYVRFCTNGTIGCIVTNGSGNGVLYNTNSDYRLKENARPIENATEKLTALPVYEYNYKGSEVKEIGFFAHELQEAHPSLAEGKKDEVDADGKPVYQSLDYGRITPLLAAALKESIARIEALEKKVAELEGK